MQYAIIAIIVLIVLFLIARELMCWYYKINAILGELRETNRLLRSLVNGDVRANAFSISNALPAEMWESVDNSENRENAECSKCFYKPYGRDNKNCQGCTVALTMNK